MPKAVDDCLCDTRFYDMCEPLLPVLLHQSPNDVFGCSKGIHLERRSSVYIPQFVEATEKSSIVTERIILCSLSVQM